MQPRVLHLLRKLGLEAGMIPSSNLVFLRSARERTIDGDMAELAEKCWPFHQAVLEVLSVRVVLCFGRTVGRWVRRRLRAEEKLAEFVEENGRKWRSTVHVNVEGIAVVDATHPSIADWTSPATDPTHLVRDALGSGGH